MPKHSPMQIANAIAQAADEAQAKKSKSKMPKSKPPKEDMEPDSDDVMPAEKKAPKKAK